MGAHDCGEYLMGADLDDQFRAARRAAEYKHGHQNDNGTISTADGVVLIDVDYGRIPSKRIRAAAWALSGTGFDAPDGDACRTEKILRKNKIPQRLWKTIKAIAGQIDESKFGYWPAIRLPAREEREFKARYGRKGTHDRVWSVFGWAAS